MKKKWFFALGILLLCCIIAAATAVWIQHREWLSIDTENTKQDGWNYTVPVTKNIESLVHQGNLLLINNQYPIHPEGVKNDIAVVAKQTDPEQHYGLLDRKIMLSRQATEQFQKMTAAAAKEGVHSFLLSSGYRNWDKQDELYREKGADYALPAGHSEHNFGLSLDIGSTLTTMNEAPEGKWLEQNAWKYGFILRYPKDKVDITGIQYEPWHFRYVGLPHSAIMYKQNMVLEQYLDFLKEQQEIAVELDGHEYHIRYYHAAPNTTIYAPLQGSYEISGDNREGIIVTAKK
ncbi:M15 family metallopeptidase [Paenibacillus sp. Z6-24]